MVCAAVLDLAPAAGPVWIAAEVLGFAVPVVFTSRYRQHLRDRVLQPA